MQNSENYYYEVAQTISEKKKEKKEVCVYFDFKSLNYSTQLCFALNIVHWSNICTIIF